jgi:hypothetical protein
VLLCLDRVSSVAMAVPWESVGWSRGVSARWGQARGPAEMASIHWGLATVLVSKQRRGRGFWQGSSLGLLLSLESN